MNPQDSRNRDSRKFFVSLRAGRWGSIALGSRTGSLTPIINMKACKRGNNLYIQSFFLSRSCFLGDFAVPQKVRYDKETKKKSDNTHIRIVRNNNRIQFKFTPKKKSQQVPKQCRWITWRTATVYSQQFCQKKNWGQIYYQYKLENAPSIICRSYICRRSLRGTRKWLNDNGLRAARRNTNEPRSRSFSGRHSGEIRAKE